jgi:di- and tripeptidase
MKADNVEDLFIKRWCTPSLSIIGIESSGTKGSVISKSVVGRISIRHVPNQATNDIIQLITQHILAKFKELQSSNQISVKTLHTGDYWLGDRKNQYYQMASRAIQEEWGENPMFVREGGTIPVTPFLERTLSAPALHFPLGQATDRAHLQNERIRLDNLVKGKEVLKRFLRKMSTKKKRESLD